MCLLLGMWWIAGTVNLDWGPSFGTRPLDVVRSEHEDMGKGMVQCFECWLDIREFKEDSLIWDLLVVQDETNAPDDW